MSVSPTLLISAVNAALRVGMGADRALAQHVRNRELIFPDAAPRYEAQITPGDIEQLADDKPVFGTRLKATHGIDVTVAGWAAKPGALAVAVRVRKAFKDGNAANDDQDIGFAELISHEKEIQQWLDDASQPISPLTRFALVFADVASEFITANPTILSPGSKGSVLIGAFAGELGKLIPNNDEEFGAKERAGARVMAVVLRAGLGVLDSNPDLFADEKHMQALITAMTKPVIEKFGDDYDISDQVHWETVMDALVGPAAAAAFGVLAEHQEAFFGSDFATEELLGQLNRQVLLTLKDLDADSRFSKEGVVEIYKAALAVIIDNPGLVVDGSTARGDFIKLLLANVGTVLRDTLPDAKGDELGVALARASLEAFGGHAGALLKLGNTPLEEAAKVALSVVLTGLKDGIGDDNKLKSLFSKPTGLRIAQVFLNQIALTPEMTGVRGDHQAIVAAVAATMAADDSLLLDDDGWIEIVSVLMQQAAANPGRLFDLDSSDRAEMLGAKVISSFLTVAATDLGEGNVLFGDTMRRAIIETIGIVASSPAEAAVALGMHDPVARNLLEELLTEVCTVVAKVKRDGRYVFGAKEWQRLYRGLLMRILANIENQADVVLTPLVEGADLSDHGKQVVDQILKTATS